MRFQQLTFPALATAAVALLAAPTLRFAPANGTTLKKTITSEENVKTTSIHFTIDGEEPEDAPDGLELTYVGNDSYVIVDEYVKSADGKPVELKRTFEELNSKFVQGGGGEPGSEPEETEKESKLASKTVVFKWDDKKDEYVVEFEDGKGDAALLKGLDADLDFLAFLPEKDVKEGDEWEVEGAKAQILMFPGGDLQLKAKDGSDEDEPDNQQNLRDNLKGKLSLKHKGVKEDDGAKLAVIEFKGDLETHGETESEKRGTVSLKVELKVTGEILWDTTHNHVHSVTMEGQDKTIYSMGADVDFGGESHKIEQKFTFEGAVKFAFQLSK